MDKAVINQLPVDSLRGKRVFVRIDAASEEPADGQYVDRDKLYASLPTLKYLTSIGARVVIGTDLGDPGNRAVESLRVNGVADQLSNLLGKSVRKLEETIGRNVLGASTEMQDGEVIVLENLRFHPGEDANDDQFARDLAALCEVYCNDAFAIAHRGRASTLAITRHVRPATAGIALARELTMFEPVIDRPEAPFFAIVAGARVEEKLAILESFADRFDRLFLGGALAFTFLKAYGHEIGAAKVNEALLPLAEDFLDRAKNKIAVIFPEDFVVVKAGLFKLFEKSGRQIPVPHYWTVAARELTSSDLPVDIGPRTVERIRQLMVRAHTFFWNGPLGIWEIGPFAGGTHAVAQALLAAAGSQRSVVAGDSLTRALRSFDLPFEQLRHLTSGGEAAMQLLAGKPLPAVAALDDEVDLIEPVEKRPRKILLPVDGSALSNVAAGKLGSLVDAAGAAITTLYVRKPAEGDAEDELMDDETKRRREIARQLEAENVLIAANAPLARQGLVSQYQRVIDGEPAREIVKMADEIGADLIAMGSHGHTGLLHYFLGSVARKVLERASCPVLIVRAGTGAPEVSDGVKFEGGQNA
ncbi:MAG: phosphoglycerate kinase [Candidatus Binatia bacterium]